MLFRSKGTETKRCGRPAHLLFREGVGDNSAANAEDGASADTGEQSKYNKGSDGIGFGAANLEDCKHHVASVNNWCSSVQFGEGCENSHG